MICAARLGTAVAQTPPPNVAARLEVAANPSCTTRDELAARVRSRAPRVRFVDDEQVLGIRAQFSASPSGGVVGDVTLGHPGDKPAQRRVLGRTCSDAADAHSASPVTVAGSLGVGVRLK